LAGCGQIDINQGDAVAIDDVVTDTVDTDATTGTLALLDGYELYTSNDYNFAIQYPAGWEFQEDAFGSHVMFFTPQTEEDQFRENIGVITEVLPTDMTVDEYYDEAKVHLMDFISDFEEVANTNITIAGEAGKKVQYLGSQGTYQLKRQQIFFIKDKVTYVVTYTAMADTFDEYVDVVDEMIGTMTIK
jgi:hypothetical protein